MSPKAAPRLPPLARGNQRPGELLRRARRRYSLAPEGIAFVRPATASAPDLRQRHLRLVRRAHAADTNGCVGARRRNRLGSRRRRRRAPAGDRHGSVWRGRVNVGSGYATGRPDGQAPAPEQRRRRRRSKHDGMRLRRRGGTPRRRSPPRGTARGRPSGRSGPPPASRRSGRCESQAGGSHRVRSSTG